MGRSGPIAAPLLLLLASSGILTAYATSNATYAKPKKSTVSTDQTAIDSLRVIGRIRLECSLPPM